MRLQILTSVALALPVPSALAQEVPYSIRGCGVAETTLVDRLGDLSVLQTLTRGVADSIPAGAAFDKTTYECRSVSHASKEGVEFTNRCVFVDADGHKFVGMSSGTPAAWQWTFLGGTGKWEGIAGRGTSAPDTRYPRLSQAVAGGCFRSQGSFSLKK
jgi:hypothetical protein